MALIEPQYAYQSKAHISCVYSLFSYVRMTLTLTTWPWYSTLTYMF